MDNELIEKVAQEHGVEPDLLHRLIELEREKVHLEKRRGIKEKIRQIIEEALDKEEE